MPGGLFGGASERSNRGSLFEESRVCPAFTQEDWAQDGSQLIFHVLNVWLRPNLWAQVTDLAGGPCEELTAR